MGKLKAASKAVQDLNFLHNTSAAKLARADQMGGMPMPSLAVTQNEIPFEGYGDITLVGRPDAFDPKRQANKIYSADAYTVRSPNPVRMARKGAGRQFQEIDAPILKELGSYTSEIESYLWDLEKKKNLNPSDFDKVVRFFESDADGAALFLREQGIDVPVRDGGQMDRSAIYSLVEPLDAQRKEWARGKVSQYFDDSEFFITNPDRDYYSQSPRLKDYTAENVANWMKRRGGTNQEGGFSSNSTAAQRAATAEQFKSLDEVRGRKGELMPREQMEAIKTANDERFFEISEALKPSFQYQTDGFLYLDNVSEAVTLAARRGGSESAIRGAFKEVGFDLDESDLQSVKGYVDDLRSSPTEYFESKPHRVVQMDEFGGAIVPEDTPRSVIDSLESQGLRVERYTDQESRLAARKKFQDLTFALSSMGVGLGLAGQSEDADAAYAPDPLAEAAMGFLASRQQKKSQWDSMRADLLNAVSGAAQLTFDSLEVPWKGILGTSRVAGGLMAGESFNDAMNAGANRVRQPLEESAWDMGAAASDATGSPAVGALVNTAVQVGGPI